MKSSCHLNNMNEPTSMTFYDDNSRGVEWLLKLLELKKAHMFCDVIISKDTSFIYAHSCILAAFSPFMMNLLKSFPNNDWSVSNPLKINVSYLTKCKKNSDMNCISCVGKVVDFLYTGDILLDYPHVSHLLNLSKNMELLNLLSVCQQFYAQAGISCYNSGLTQQLVHESSNTALNVSKTVKCLVTSDLKCSRESTGNNGPSLTETPNSNKLTSGDFKGENDGYVKLDIKHKEEQIKDLLDFHEKRTHKCDDGICAVNDERSGEYYCIKCKLRFSSFKMFEAHKKVFHKRQFICLSCNFTTFKLSYIVFHLINMNHEENCCSVCLFKAKDCDSLKVHLQDHKSDFPFRCYECGNLFKARTEWLRHMLLHNVQEKHNSNSTLICEVCGFVAPYKSVFERHSLKHNKLNKTFTCPVIPCPFNTYSKYNLKQHILTHEAEKCFICNICSLKFSQEKNLKRHIQTLHEPQAEPYKCFKCDYKSARIDKIKEHCHSVHPADNETLSYVLKQQKDKKFDIYYKKSEESKENLESHKPKDDKPNLKNIAKKGDPEKEGAIKSASNPPEIDPISIRDGNKKNTFILSETTGEFNIISENEGESIPVASVTSKNVLTIGNFRAGTGSVTLNESTGILTFNNINSESTGAVFLNESTGELSYINLNKESLSMDIEKSEPKYCREVITQLNEFTGEIFTIDNEKKLPDFNDDDTLFDSFDMDIGNEDSCDGFDDIDGLLFDPIDIEGTSQINLLISDSGTDTIKTIPHLNEATGELSFGCMESQSNNIDVWTTECAFNEEENEDPYRLLLNEVTGELS